MRSSAVTASRKSCQESRIMSGSVGEWRGEFVSQKGSFKAQFLFSETRSSCLQFAPSKENSAWEPRDVLKLSSDPVISIWILEESNALMCSPLTRPLSKEVNLIQPTEGGGVNTICRGHLMTFFDNSTAILVSATRTVVNKLVYKWHISDPRSYEHYWTSNWHETWKNSGPYGIWTHDLCDTGAALHQLYGSWSVLQRSWVQIPHRPEFLLGLISNSSSVAFIAASIAYNSFLHRSANIWFSYISSHSWQILHHVVQRAKVEFTFV